MIVFMFHLLFMNRVSKVFCVPVCQNIAQFRAEHLVSHREVINNRADA